METLPESEIEPLEMHLLVCEACQDRLKHWTSSLPLSAQP